MDKQNRPIKHIASISAMSPTTEITPWAVAPDAEEDDAASVMQRIEIADQRRHKRQTAMGALFDELWNPHGGLMAKERWADLWDDERRRWLRKQRSPHTQRAYEGSFEEWRRFIRESFAIDYLWMAEPFHVVAWMDSLRENGAMLNKHPSPLSNRTINRHLAAVSSYYKHMRDCTRIVDGVQVPLLASANGSALPNPFESGTIRRPVVVQYGDSKAIPTAALQWILREFGEKDPIRKTIADYRDHALILTFYRTGYRAESVLSMKWGDLEERQDGKAGMIHAWTGKGGKEKKKALSNQIYAAIVAYLKEAGRWHPGEERHIQPGDYIWKPIRTAGCANFGIEVNPEDNRHITAATAADILRRRLATYYMWKLLREDYPRAGRRNEALRLARRFHLHCLRHSFASELAEASNDNIMLVQELLDHESPATTKLYIGRIKQPEDRATELLQQRFGI